MAKKKDNSNDSMAAVAVAASAALTALVLLRTFELVQDLRYGFQGAPNSYAFWPALVLAIFAFATAKETKVKYVAIAVIAVLTTSIMVWLFGVAGTVSPR